MPISHAHGSRLFCMHGPIVTVATDATSTSLNEYAIWECFCANIVSMSKHNFKLRQLYDYVSVLCSSWKLARKTRAKGTNLCMLVCIYLLL